jgi:hypothetical protein
MDAQEQGLELEATLAGDDDLPVEDAAVGEAGLSGAASSGK